MSNADPRGDLGVIPDPSWEARWSAWSPEAIQRHLAEAARYGILSRVQAIALLQGLPPPPRGGDSTDTVLADYESVVDRFGQDVARGQISGTPTPQELAAWADAMGEELPEAFLVALKTQTVKVGAPRIGTAPGGAKIEVPVWAATLLGSAASTAPAARRKVGRPETTAADKQALIEKGKAILVSAAAEGKTISLMGIGKKLQGSPIAGARSAATIKRLLTGELDVGKARIKALVAASKPAK